jgi:Asp/Glu/hydantoin racemase
MTGPGTDDFDETLDHGIDAVILDRMTDTLMILQCKHPTEDRAAMIAALKAVRDHDDQGVKVIVVEGESDERLVRQFLDKLNRTSIGTDEVYVARANASARRVADILGRAIEQPGKAD